jgi:hypothetical protein
MKGGIFNRDECCDQPCECPVCLEDKPLMRLNCNHYVCLDDIQSIINSNPRKLQNCPICRVLITNYGCNGNVVNIDNVQIQQPLEDETVTVYDSDYEYEDDDRPMYRNYGGKIRIKRTRKNTKRTKKRKTKKRTLRKRRAHKMKKKRRLTSKTV